MAARACARLVIANDFEGVVNCMPDEVVKSLGGRSAIIATVRRVSAEMSRGSVRMVQSLIEPPTQVLRAGTRTFAILPQVVVVRVPEGHVRQRTFLLAVSSDDGHTWRFVDGVELNRELASQMFPDFPASLTLPNVDRPELVTADK
jgi:hypothetical protein